MAEYREIRSKYSFLTMCKTPELASQVTLQPINGFDLDAAIIFADILLPLEPMGIELEFAKNEGPIIRNPVYSKSDVDKLHLIDSRGDLAFVMEAIGIVRRELENRVPLIGFSGAPFTLASYIVEGGHSRNYTLIKSMMYRDPSTYQALMEKVSTVVTDYLRAQIESGVQAVQIFDSWAGCLSPGDYEDYVLPYAKKVIDGLADFDVPVINFATGVSAMLDLLTRAGGDVIGVDWRIHIDKAWDAIGTQKGIQGNLDPVVLFSSTETIELKTKDILNRVAGRPGHIFNLGHGILPETPVDNVRFLIDKVHELTGKEQS